MILSLSFYVYEAALAGGNEKFLFVFSPTCAAISASWRRRGSEDETKGLPLHTKNFGVGA